MNEKAPKNSLLHKFLRKPTEEDPPTVHQQPLFHCVVFFSWFDKSTKRKATLKEHCVFCDTEYEEVVKYVSVRWLCLEHCMNRELKKYHALKSNFLSEHESDNRFKRLNESFQHPMSEICHVFSISNCLAYEFQPVFAKGRSCHILDEYTDGKFPKQVDLNSQDQRK